MSNKQLLFFKKHLFEKIKEGQKCSTLRLKNHMNVGDVVRLTCGHHYIEAIIIERENFALEEINEEILNNEGIATTQDLQKILNECYPNQNINSLIYLKFKLNDTN